MKIIWIAPLLLIQSYRIIGSHLQEEYNQYSFYQKRPLSPRPLDAMADLTNDLGVCVLRVIAAGGAIGNIAFSPFGLMAVSVLLYEGSSGYSALQIKQSLNLPWEVLAVRIGVRDLNRYLKTYFKSDGFLNGLTMSREEVCLRPQFKRVLKLYGFDDPDSFLIDSCPESASTTMQPISVTTHGTVVTEMTPTSQTIQIASNITTGSASNLSALVTELPAKVTHVADASFTISNIDANTNLPMHSQTVTMIVDIETQPHIMPIESTTNQVETTILTNEQEPKSSNEIEVTDDTKLNESILTEKLTESTTPISSDDPMMQAAATVTRMNVDYRSITKSSQADQLIKSTVDSESRTNPTETFTTQSRDVTTSDDTSDTSSAYAFGVGDETVLSSNSFVTSTEINPDITVAYNTENMPKTTIDNESKESNTINDKYVSTENTAQIIMSTTNEAMTDVGETTKSMNTDSGTIEMVSFSKPMMFTGDDTSTTFQVNSIPAIVTDQAMSMTKSGLNSNNDATTDDGNLITTTDISSTATMDLNNSTENEIIKEAESNQHYQIVSSGKKIARAVDSNDNLPTFNVEFSVSKEDLRPDCNQTRKRTIIRPDKILTEYPKNSGISITLREMKKRRKRHLEQYQGYNVHRNQWFNGYKAYPHQSGWMDRSSNPFDSANWFNTGYYRIPFFTYTAVLPFGFVDELKSQVIEIPLDDPKYTLMILMPNHPDGLSELLLLLPSMSLRNIHNSLKPTAIHATIPSFKYTAKVDLTSALQQIGIRDVFYRYRADLSFMSPDARLFVSSVQQVVSVTAKKYNTPPVYEIQPMYVKQEFVVSRPFVYFVMDIHTKVSLIAGVITDPLASPIWV